MIIDGIEKVEAAGLASMGSTSGLTGGREVAAGGRAMTGRTGR